MRNNWIVVIGSGSWAKCYGPFDSYDDVMTWVRANQFDVENASAHPVTPVDPPSPAISGGANDERAIHVLSDLWLWASERRTHLDTDPVPDGLGAMVIAVLEGKPEVGSVSAQRSEWRPIATAPKDKRWLLGWHEDFEFFIFRDGPGLITGEDPMPTHWMPLPPAPVEELSHHSVAPSRSAAQGSSSQFSHSPAIEQAKEELGRLLAVQADKDLHASASRLQEVEKALGNCYIMAKRELHRLGNLPAADARSVERWGHILRFCEETGQKSNILRATLPTELTDGSELRLQEVEAERDWQPIESAPVKTRILVVDTDGVVGIGYLEPDGMWDVHGFITSQSPTHWMPLPAVCKNAFSGGNS